MISIPTAIIGVDTDLNSNDLKKRVIAHGIKSLNLLGLYHFYFTFILKLYQNRMI